MPDQSQAPVDPNVPPFGQSQPPNPPPSAPSASSTPSFGLTQEQNSFSQFPQVENQTSGDSVLVPNNPMPSTPNPGSAMTVAPDNSSNKFTLFIVVLGAIVGLILAGVVYLYLSNQSLAEPLSQFNETSALG